MSVLLFLRHVRHVGIFHHADDLHAARIVMLEVTGQLQSGPVDIALPDLRLGKVYIRRQQLELHFFDNFL